MAHVSLYVLYSAALRGRVCAYFKLHYFSATRPELLQLLQLHTQCRGPCNFSSYFKAPLCAAQFPHNTGYCGQMICILALDNVPTPHDGF